MADGLPVLGSARPLMANPLAFLVQQYLSHGPIFTVKALNRRFTVLAGPEANQFLSTAGDAHLSGRYSWSTFADEIDSQSFLAAIDGEPHSRMRKILKKPYSRSVIMEQLPATVDLTRAQLEQWRPDDTFVVFPAMQRLIAEQIGQLLLGSGPGDTFPDFVVFMRTLLNAVLGQWPKMSLRMPRYRRAKARVMQLSASMLAAHRARPVTEGEEDLIDYLLAASVDNPDLLSEPELLIGALGPYLAGIDTAAATTSFMIYALLKHPETLARLQVEVDAAFGEGPLTGDKLRKMPVLHAVAQETLRLYPVAPMVPRTVVQPFSFAGHQLQEMEPVMAATGVAHFDPRLYKDPSRFDIDRCLPPRLEQRQPGAFAPYGFGSHTCAGAGFAEVEIMATAATLFHELELALADPAYELRTTYSPSPAPDKQCRVRVVRRRV
jgi:cytochrome P450